MNDLEREIRETFLGHQDDIPPFDVSEARWVAGRARQQQIRNMLVGGVASIAAVILVIVGLGGLVRADRSPTVLDEPSASPSCVLTPEPDDVAVDLWPDTTDNPPGVYSWDARDHSDYRVEGHMHNAYGRGSGAVTIFMQGRPGRLVPHRGETTATLAGCEATYRDFVGEVNDTDGRWEQWMVDIQGTTVTVSLSVGPKATEAEALEAYAIIDSIRAEPANNALGFRLLFTLTTGTWDSG